MKIYFLLIAFLLITVNTTAQIIYGTNNYVEYHIGNLPIIISVPHGGNLIPSDLPNRTCNNPTLGTDLNTIELAQQISQSLFDLTGCRPHMIYCNLKRTKIDCNRNITDGACGNFNAEIAWTEFHNFLANAQTAALNQVSGKALYFDLHGHAHTIQRIELGYLLTGNQLGFSNSILNSQAYVDLSSIKNLVMTNVNSYTHSELLTGSNALGTLLGNAGYESIPSQQTPAPLGNPYFSGGYNTENYTSIVNGNSVNGCQIEANYTNVRDNAVNRQNFANAFSSVLINYFDTHYNINLINCTNLSINKFKDDRKVYVYPNFLNQHQFIQISGKNIARSKFYISNLLGQKIETGFVDSENKCQINKIYKSGYYIISIEENLNLYNLKIFFN